MHRFFDIYLNDDTIAYAAYCHQDKTTDRPISGYVNLCPNDLSSLPNKLHLMQSTIQHEILHALAFSVPLFPYFRDENGTPLTKRNDTTGKPLQLNSVLSIYQYSDKVIKKVIYKNWMTRSGNIEKVVNLMVTPNVVREVRQHFNCTTLIGAELENQGNSGTAISHWEKRIFENEAMTGAFTQNSVISRISFALMHDTGWYIPNYSYADDLEWGKNLGCSFVTESCLSWMKNRKKKNKSLRPYCDTVQPDSLVITECDGNHKTIVMCNLIKYPQPLPTDYQNFLSIPGITENNLKYYGSSVALSDYCPYFQEFDWSLEDEFQRTSACNVPGNQLTEKKNYKLEVYDKSSICIDNSKTIPWTVKNCFSGTSLKLKHVGSACYKYACKSSRINVLLHNNYSFTCDYDGQIVRIQAVVNEVFHEGLIICPECSKFCPNCGDNNRNITSTEKLVKFNDINCPIANQSTIMKPTNQNNALFLFIFIYIYFQYIL